MARADRRGGCGGHRRGLRCDGTLYYAFDGHGNARYLSDATGTATDFYTYDAFGNMVYKAGTTANAYLFPDFVIQAAPQRRGRLKFFSLNGENVIPRLRNASATLALVCVFCGYEFNRN
jgi:hypothetical protein